MPTFGEIAEEIGKIDIIRSFVAFAKTRNNKIIETIQKRLLSKGTTGDGIRLKTDSAGTGQVYSPVTIIFKERQA
jgi:hypothetical protein